MVDYRDERQRLRHALLTRPIPRLLLHLPLPLPPNPTQPPNAPELLSIQPTPALQPPTAQSAPANTHINPEPRARGIRRAQSHLPQLPHSDPSRCRMYSGCCVCGGVVWSYGVGAEGRVGGGGVG